MTRRCDLLAEPGRARARGYARNSGESEEGVSSTGLAIVHPQHGVLGAITIAVLVLGRGGLRSAASIFSRYVSAWMTAFFAALTAAAAVFFAGFGTSRPGSSGAVAQESRAPGAKWVRA